MKTKQNYRTLILETTDEKTITNHNTSSHKDFEISHLTLKKPKGNCTIIDNCNIVFENKDNYVELIKVLSKELNLIIEDFNYKKKPTVLIVGIGNENVTPDSLGARICEKIFVTGYCYDDLSQDASEQMAKTFTIVPGVQAATGFYTANIVKGLIHYEKSIDLVVVVDSLATRDINKLNNSIQITNLGLTPGSFGNNNKYSITKNFLGKNVISIGVPTILSYEQKNNKENDEVFYVTVTDIFEKVETFSRVISNAINITLNDNFHIKDIDFYVL